MNDDLKTALMTAEASLSAEFGFELDHGRREVVWAALGPRLSATGRQRRGRLAITVARHVLPLWERVWPSNRLPQQLLALADNELVGTSSDLPEELEDVDNLFWDMIAAGEPTALYAGLAALRAWRAARRDEEFDPLRPRFGVPPGRIDFFDLDAAAFAAIAYAGGSYRNTEASPERRREFCLWYLHEAVPSVAE